MLGRVYGPRCAQRRACRSRCRLALRYLRAAGHPVWSTELLAGRRNGPFGFILFVKLLAQNLRLIVIVQSAIAAAAWLLLAQAVAELLETAWVRLVGFVVILLVALSPTVLLWNVTISTESLAVSLLAAALAFWIRRSYVALTVALVGLACVRDTNAYLLALVALIGFVSALTPSARRRGVAIGCVCIVGAGVNLVLAQHAQRWYDPLSDIVALRVVPDHGRASTS